jgi:cell division protein FtsZ
VRVTVIAAGFDGGMPKKRDNGTVLRREPVAQQSQSETRAAAQQGGVLPSQPTSPQSTPAPVGYDTGRPTTGAPLTPSRQQEPEHAGVSARSSQPQQSTTPAPRQPRPVHFDDDELDVPDFLK